MIGFLFSAEVVKKFLQSSPPHPDRLGGPLIFLTSGFLGPFLRGVKRSGSEADHSPPSSIEPKYVWSYTSTPIYVFIAWCLVKHRDKFTFTFISQIKVK
jgi:hypothetical protein